MKILMAAIPCALAVLCGCSGGAPGNETTGSPSGASSTSASEETVHFEGNWVGTLTSDQEQHSSTAILLVNGWGEFRLIADGMQFVGWPRRTETSLAGTVTGIRAAGTSWNDGSTSGIFDIGGTITGNDLIDGTYLGAGDNGVFTLTWVAGDESRGEAIAGSWVQYDANENIVASFQVDQAGMWVARLRGSHGNGCQYSGEFDAWTNWYSYDLVPVEVSGCPLVDGVDLNGTYSGTAALLELNNGTTNGPVLVLALSNDQHKQMTLFLSPE